MVRKLNPAVFLTLDPILDEGELLFGSGNDGFVYQMEVGESDDGDDIEGKWVTGWLDMGEPEITKMFMTFHADVEAIAGTLFVDWDVDNGVASDSFEIKSPRGEGGVWQAIDATWNKTTKVWGGPADIRKKRVIVELPQEAEGQRIKVTLRAEDKILAWQVTNFSVLYKSKEALTPMGDI